MFIVTNSAFLHSRSFRSAILCRLSDVGPKGPEQTKYEFEFYKHLAPNGAKERTK